MADRVATTEDPIIIKKYANRRLYNTSSSSYITLDDLAGMTREGMDFQVLDAKSGNDITHAILTQIIMEEEANGAHMLPVSFLRELISMYGDSLQAIMPAYLEASMQNFRKNQADLQAAFKASVEPQSLAKLAETNITSFQAVASSFMLDKGAAEPQVAAIDSAQNSEELNLLRQEMTAMQKRLDRLGQ